MKLFLHTEPRSGRLKACYKPAQGNALGATQRNTAALKGRNNVVSPFQGFATRDRVSRGVAPGWFVMLLRSANLGSRVHSYVFFAAVLVALTGASSAADPQKPNSSARLHRIDPKTTQGLQDLFRHTGEPLPFVSAHRGGAQRNFPENCIATFENTLQHTFAILEIDPRLAKDGSIVVHHDATLDRTTTGKGRVVDFTLEELKQLRLKDNEGNVTGFQIPTLDEVLEWARGKTILVLDQKDVPVAARVKKIEQHKAEAYAMLIVNTFKDAQACYALNTNIMMEVMIPNRAKAEEFDQLDIPWRNVVAFVGHVPPEDTTLYEAVHGKGALCMVGTSRNLDRKIITREVADIKLLEPGYRAFLKRGADLIETDIASQLGQMLYGVAPIPESKQRYFHAK